MVTHNPGQHHLHKRKRIHVKHEKYPSKNKWKRFLDKIMYPIAFIGPLMMIPQILKIYIAKDASALAASTWILFFFISIMWMIYGATHKDKVIFSSNIAWLISYAFLIAGIILY
jgi:uncharacterized protein with PQ loop repeat